MWSLKRNREVRNILGESTRRITQEENKHNGGFCWGGGSKKTSLGKFFPRLFAWQEEHGTTRRCGKREVVAGSDANQRSHHDGTSILHLGYSGDTGGEEGHMVTGWGAWKLINDARNHQTIKPLEEVLHQEQD